MSADRIRNTDTGRVRAATRDGDWRHSDRTGSGGGGRCGDHSGDGRTGRGDGFGVSRKVAPKSASESAPEFAQRSDWRGDWTSDGKKGKKTGQSPRRSDHGSDYGSDRRPGSRSDHRTGHQSGHRSDHQSDHRSDHRSGRAYDRENDRGDRRRPAPGSNRIGRDGFGPNRGRAGGEGPGSTQGKTSRTASGFYPEKGNDGPGRASREGAGCAGTEAAGQESVRLNRYLAGTGLCSRRRADELVEAGRVTVNGRVAGPGDRVCPGDRVLVDGEPVETESETVCLLLHKPVRVVSTASDPEGRRTVLDFVPERWRGLRLYPVGRLDYYSEGLILLTNDGPLANRLTHPSHGQEKRYEVLVKGRVGENHQALVRMRRGMRLKEGDATRPCRVRVLRQEEGATLLSFVLGQGLNRQIRRMCRDTGLTVLRLKRVAEGGLELGSLKVGAVRELTPAEVASLRGE